MKTCTVVNKTDHPGLKLWQLTGELLGHEVQVLLAPSDRPLGHESKQFGQKFLVLQSFLETLSDDETLLVTDGFDVVFLQPPYVIEQRALEMLKTSGADILFAGELYENPDQHQPYRTHQKPFPFLNSGVYFGSVKSIKLLLQPVIASSSAESVDDQRYMTQQYFEQREGCKIEIDHDAKLFACLAGTAVNDFSLKSRSASFLAAETELGVLHFQGYFKNVLPFLDKVWARDTEFIRRGGLSLAHRLHRMPHPLTPVFDMALEVGRSLPWGEEKPFLALGAFLVLFALALVLNRVM